MADDEKRALEFLKDTAKNAAKGLAEESDVYRVAENIVNNNKYLFGTVNTILNKELGVSFDVGKNKEIGFAASPDKASLGFKMSFAEGDPVGGGFIEKQKAGMKLDEQSLDDLFTNWKNKSPKSKSMGEIRTLKKRLAEILSEMDEFKGRSLSEIKFSEIDNLSTITDIWDRFYTRGWKGKGINLFRSVLNKSGLGNENIIKEFLDSPAFTEMQKKYKLVTEGGYSIREPEVSFKKKFGEAVSAIEHDMPSDMKVQVSKGKFTSSVPNSAKRFAKIAIHSGFRPIDIYRVSFNDIDFNNGWIRLTSGKSGTGQIIKSVQPVSQDVLNFYAQQINAKGGIENIDPNKPIFNVTGNEVKDVAAYNKKVSTATENIGIKQSGKKTGVIKSKGWSIYDFRHYHMFSAAKNYNPTDIDFLTQHGHRGKWSKMLEQYASSTDKLDMSQAGPELQNLKTQVVTHNTVKRNDIGIKGEDITIYDENTRNVPHQRGKRFQGNQFTKVKGDIQTRPITIEPSADISEFQQKPEVDIKKDIPEQQIKKTELQQQQIQQEQQDIQDKPFDPATKKVKPKAPNLKGETTFSTTGVKLKRGLKTMGTIIKKGAPKILPILAPLEIYNMKQQYDELMKEAEKPREPLVF